MRASSRFFSTIQARIMGLFVLMFVLAIFLMFVVVSGMLGNFLVNQRVNQDILQVDAITANLAQLIKNPDADILFTEAVNQSKKLGGRVLILDKSGQVLADSHSGVNGQRIQYQEVLDVLYGGRSNSYGFHKIQGSSLGIFSPSTWAVYYTASIVSESVTEGAVLVSMDVQDVQDSLNDTLIRMAGGCAIILAGLLIVSTLFSRWLTRPIVHMTEALNKMSQGRFDQRVEVPSSTEIGEMAATINMMSERLENLDETRNSFISNASHELKTPLSSIKILAESLLYQEGIPEATYQEFLGDINQQIDRMVELLNDLLVLSQADDEEKGILKTLVPVDDMVRSIMLSVGPMAEEKHILLRQIPSGLNAYCDQSLIHTALQNLVNNGVKYTPEGGTVTVSATGTADGVYIRVEDTGIGIPEEDRSQIFERFYRVDKARARDTGGTGLGLSIVDAILRLHGGRVTLESVVDEGSIFTIFLPKEEVEAS
ncbi:HAMP domain-containing histidine kinase [Eubacteriales bacterium OttesenSCG-928-M02]|nr:HAMP domain-containing histidine kinase [Eubacteriales bacterium OttesenSCG-928-M02]